MMERQITGYVLAVHKGPRAGMVRHYGPDQGRRARNFADKLDRDYGAVCATVSPKFEALTGPAAY